MITLLQPSAWSSIHCGLCPQAGSSNAMIGSSDGPFFIFPFPSHSTNGWQPAYTTISVCRKPAFLEHFRSELVCAFQSLSWYIPPHHISIILNVDLTPTPNCSHHLPGSVGWTQGSMDSPHQKEKEARNGPCPYSWCSMSRVTHGIQALSATHISSTIHSSGALPSHTLWLSWQEPTQVWPLLK